MLNLYSENDLKVVRSKLNRRLFLLCAFLLVILTLIIGTLIMDDHKANRPQLLTSVLVLLFGFTTIFCWDLFCRPLSCYRKHIDTSLHGRLHETVMEYGETEPDLSLIEGVSYRGVIFLGEPDKHGIKERRFYWDAELPIPDFSAGERVALRYHDRYIVAYGNESSAS